MATQTSRSAKQRFLDVNDQEHKITMRLLRAYPTDKLDLRPHHICKTARELAWAFVMERAMGQMAFRNEFASGRMPMQAPPPPPQDWNKLLSEIENAHRDFQATISGFSEPELDETVKFFVAPKTMGDVSRIDIAWMLLHDQIHHRGQFSIYQRMAGGKVPSIYGPTADEPWM